MGSSPGIDADGDTKMGGKNTLKVARAVINALGGNQSKQGIRKPPPEWSPLDEFGKTHQRGQIYPLLCD
ncbi:hypothetical protein K3495_g3466 [Podosphaera aphanis]|nr:hypothetical protein K3495_g3466 [Podosphaera aphanis]